VRSAVNSDEACLASAIVNKRAANNDGLVLVDHPADLLGRPLGDFVNTPVHIQDQMRRAPDDLDRMPLPVQGEMQRHQFLHPAIEA
jgi:hypothetical protein